MFDDLSTAWRTAAADLGIRVEAPFRLHQRFLYPAWVKDFGGPNGMLILAFEDWDLIAAAEAEGFGFSVMESSFYQSYDRALFIEALEDWEWSIQSSPPDWYRESKTS